MYVFIYKRIQEACDRNIYIIGHLNVLLEKNREHYIYIYIHTCICMYVYI